MATLTQRVTALEASVKKLQAAPKGGASILDGASAGPVVDPVVSKQWLSAPYYLTQGLQKVNGHIALESALQRMVESSLSDAAGFLTGSKDFLYKTPDALIAVFANGGRSHVEFYHEDEGIGTAEAMAMGVKYGLLLLDKLKQIQAPGKSVSIYDAWTGVK